MAAITVQVTGLEQAMRKLSPKVARDAAKRGMTKATINAASQAKRNASGRPGPNVDTGRLRSSITSDVRDGGSSIEGVIGSNVIYARIQELGGTITAKGGGFLRFKTRDGAWHMVRSVNIPPRPYLAPAVSSPFAQRAIYTYIANEVSKALGAK